MPLIFIRDMGKERIKSKTSNREYWCYLAEYYCSYCGSYVIRKKPSKNNSCGCQQFNKETHRKATGPRGYVKHDRSKQSINCVNYLKCLDEAGRKDLPMQCNKCDKFEFKQDCFKDELDSEVCAQDYDEFIEYNIVN